MDDVLLTISEVAIAIAGFGGIAAGIGYRSQGSWTKQDRFRLMVMEASSLSLVFVCLVPYALEHLGISEQWRKAAILLVIVPVGNLIAQFRVVGIGFAAGYNPFFTISIMLSNLGGFVLASILILGILGEEDRSGAYLAAVLLLLIPPAILFLRLLVTSFSELRE